MEGEKSPIFNLEPLDFDQNGEISAVEGVVTDGIFVGGTVLAALVTVATVCYATMLAASFGHIAARSRDLRR